MRIKGKVEVFTRRSVSGWISTFGDLYDRPRLELLLDGISLASAPADGFRPDVASEYQGDGICHFEITLPDALSEDEVQRVHLRIAESELLLELPREAPSRDSPSRQVADGLASPVFIVGSPRSGTTALAVGLAAGGYHGFEEGNLLGLSKTIEREVDSYFTNNDALPGTLLGNVSKATLNAQVFSVFSGVLDQLNPIKPWFDKTPNPDMILMLPRIMEAWPGSRVIFAKRRGIENVLSRLAKYPERDFAFHCEDWADNMRAWRTTRELLDPARITEVDQRETLETPEFLASRLGTLLGFDETQQRAVAAAFRTERPEETFPGSAARATTASEAGWTEGQIRTFEALCGKEMRFFNYDLDMPY